MLNFFRRSALMVKIFFVVLLALMSLSLVITLIPGMTGITTDASGIEVVAEVGGEPITSWQVQQGVLQMGRNNQVPSEMLWLYTDQVLDQMIMEKAVVLEAERMGLRVTEDDLRRRLRMIQELFPGGKFVGQQQYEDMVLSRFGTSVEEFETRFRNGLLRERLRQVVTDSIGVSPEEIHAAFVRDNEKLVLQYVFLEPAAFRSAVAATDAALQEYYQSNASRYQLPEQRRAKILLIESQKVRDSVSVTDAEMQKYYQDHIENYRVPERVAVRHILFRATDKEPEKLAQARQKAADVMQRLKAGRTFEQLAAEFSEDTANAMQGGDLGWIVRGQTVPNFENVAFRQQPGTVSDPIQTEYGIHILKVTAHEQAHVRPFEEVKAEIQKTLQEEKAQSALSGIAERAAAEWRRDPSQAAAVAAQHHGTVVSPPPFARGEVIAGIPGSQAVSEDVAILEAGQIGRPVAVSNGYAIPMLEEILPPRTPELAEIREKVRSDYIDEKAREIAQAKALELAQALERQTQRNLAAQARSMGLTVRTTEPLTRAQAIPSVGPMSELGPRLETIQPGEIAGPVPIAGGQLVYQLQSRQPPNEADFATQRDLIRQRLLSQKQSVAFALYEENLKARMMESGDIRIHAEVLERLNRGAMP